MHFMCAGLKVQLKDEGFSWHPLPGQKCLIPAQQETKLQSAVGSDTATLIKTG